jgi:sugar transferase (PEP-CTERM system associated)
MSEMRKMNAQEISLGTVLLVFVDVLFVLSGLLLGITLRGHARWEIVEYLRGPYVVARFLFVVLVCEISLYYSGLYERSEFSNGFRVFMSLLQALASISLVLAIVYYLDNSMSLGRGIAAVAVPVVFVLMLCSRILIGETKLFLSEPKRVLVVGTGPTGVSAVREILVRPELNLQVEGFLDEQGENIGKSLVNPGIIGALQEVEPIALDRRVNRIIISLMERRGHMPVSQLLHLKFTGVEVEDAHSFIEKVTGRIHLEHLSPSWLILSDGFRKSPFLYSAKRTFDIVLALVALALSAPVMVLIAAAVWLETGSPILFRQERTGFKGHTFEILKFRSMYQNAEQNGPVWATRDDHRVTRVGRLIRKFRLDELPQILNVVRGEMSLVGPRPERPQFCQILEQRIPFFALRETVRPGITGWAQVKYQYGSSIEEAQVKLEYDFFYIKNMSLVLDLAILLETGKVMFYGRGAK